MSLEYQESKNSRLLNSTLENFDNLPDAAHVRQPVVEALYACSSATLWRYVKAGVIPHPKRFGGRITAWNVGELRNSLEDK